MSEELRIEEVAQVRCGACQSRFNVTSWWTSSEGESVTMSEPGMDGETFTARPTFCPFCGHMDRGRLPRNLGGGAKSCTMSYAELGERLGRQWEAGHQDRRGRE